MEPAAQRGEPVDLDGAKQLAVDDPYPFQWWILGRVGARPADKKKGADSGIDGELLFRDSPNTPLKRAVISVKSGNLQPAYVRELVGVVHREGAAIGVLLTLKPPTQAMKTEAAKAGFFESHVGRHPKIQILTAAQVLDGHPVNAPGAHVAKVRRRAVRRLRMSR